MDFCLSLTSGDCGAILAPVIPEEICIGRQHPFSTRSGDLDREIIYSISGVSVVIDDFRAELVRAYKSAKIGKEGEPINVKKLANSWANYLKDYLRKKGAMNWCLQTLVLIGKENNEFKLYHVDRLGVVQTFPYAAFGQLKSFALSFLDSRLKNSAPKKNDIDEIFPDFISALDSCTSQVRMPKRFILLILQDSGLETKYLQ